MKAKEFLSQRGVPYVVKWVDQDRAAAVEMVRLSGQQGVPVIAVDDQIVVGFNRPRLESLLAARPKAATAANGKPGLGARVADAATMALRRPNLPGSGAYVGGVREGSPAARAGLRVGDVIVAVGQTPVRDATGLEAALAGEGDNWMIQYVRDGQPAQITVAR